MAGPGRRPRDIHELFPEVVEYSSRLEVERWA